jgi:hypothetical protein
MIFDYTVSRGQLLFLYEFAAFGSGAPVAATVIQDRILAGSENAITPREIIIGGF